MRTRRTALAVPLTAAYIATILAANWAINRFGAVPVGFGYEAPAGVYFAGLAFTLRDGVQETAGRRVTILAILAGAAASALVSPRFAVASATAFLVSEGADFLAYTPLREKGRWVAAVAVSNSVGLLIDSTLFLWLAFHSLEYLPGQIIGKTWTTIVALVPLVAWRIGKERKFKKGLATAY